MHDPPYFVEIYDFMMELIDDHNPDDAKIEKRDDGPAIVLQWDTEESDLVFQYDDYQTLPEPNRENIR